MSKKLGDFYQNVVAFSEYSNFIQSYIHTFFVHFLENEAFLRRVAMVPNGILRLLTSKMSKKMDNPDWRSILHRASQTGGPRGAIATPVFWQLQKQNLLCTSIDIPSFLELPPSLQLKNKSCNCNQSLITNKDEQSKQEWFLMLKSHELKF